LTARICKTGNPDGHELSRKAGSPVFMRITTFARGSKVLLLPFLKERLEKVLFRGFIILHEINFI